MLGVAFYIDEMIMHFKGHHEDKKRMTYKAKGDGLQTFDICQKVYTYQIFICNDPSPETYLAKYVLPLHARVMALFDTVGKNTINGQWIIYTTHPKFSRHRTITRENTDSWCYEERNERYPSMRFTIGIEVKEGKY